MSSDMLFLFLTIPFTYLNYHSPINYKGLPIFILRVLAELLILNKKITMENLNENKKEDVLKNIHETQKRGKIFTGIVLVSVGVILLSRELGAEIPRWLISWKMLLIVIGISIGVKHKFHNPSWLVLVLIGSVFLISDIYPSLYIKPMLWPILIIIAGLFVIFKPQRHKNKYCKRRHDRKYAETGFYIPNESINTDETIDWFAFMGGLKKNVLSKNFKNGEINVVFGGAEVNFTQTDFVDKATLEINQLFGGTKLIIPANWEIKSELVSVFGGIEDKRPLQTSTSSTNKILILKGVVVFGGIDIRSY
jgi:predicted membrane protein